MTKGFEKVLVIFRVVNKQNKINTFRNKITETRNIDQICKVPLGWRLCCPPWAGRCCDHCDRWQRRRGCLNVKVGLPSFETVFRCNYFSENMMAFCDYICDAISINQWSTWSTLHCYNSQFIISATALAASRMSSSSSSGESGDDRIIPYGGHVPPPVPPVYHNRPGQEEWHRRVTQPGGGSKWGNTRNLVNKG